MRTRMTEPADATGGETSAGSGLLAELSWRGLVQESSQGLAARLGRGPTSGYIGFDASATSLHVGHLLQVFLLTHLQRAGGRPVVVIGGATGMIGDPSGKSSERKLLDDEAISRNAAAIKGQLESFLDFSPGPTEPLVVDNRELLGKYSMLEFLREIGKHFSIPYMLAKDSVQQRLAAGMSFTEFSYMTLQSADFLHLHRDRGVELQLGGADQWGNITAGLELIRRVEGHDPTGVERAHGLSYPLLLDATGQKFGKTTEGTAVWLDPGRTSPYAFYQFWLDRDDAEVGRLLRMFTLFELGEIEAIETDSVGRPEARLGQRALARDLTQRVHGPEILERVTTVSAAVFSRTLPSLGPEALAYAFEQLPNSVVGPDALVGGPVGLAVAAGLFSSNGAARRTISQG